MNKKFEDIAFEAVSKLLEELDIKIISKMFDIDGNKYSPDFVFDRYIIDIYENISEYRNKKMSIFKKKYGNKYTMILVSKSKKSVYDHTLDIEDIQLLKDIIS